ncbi:grpE protein homolog 2, mitochondrial-like isoform X2 [Oryza brachyantha]|uniref:grpE protein homolog 2, mitochondrial-like isoform X2 n=1 Tax=Oryza brachyantha TaxID=4533 RepID=UPI001ADC4C1A|nr:grpE protein homolog 2, mitochondrial-like isoform X2 [Oryza brachyantha]
MAAPRLLARFSRQGVAAAAAAARRHHDAAALLGASAGRQFVVASCSSTKVLPLLNQPRLYSTSIFQRFGFSSSAPQQDDKEGNKPTEDGVNKSTQSETEASNETNNSSGTKNASQADTEDLDLSKEDLTKLVLEKEELLKSKDEEIKDMKDKVLRSYAEMENVIARTKRESDNAKKYAVQGFSKSLLDVADNLSRASSVVKESFSKIDTSNDSAEAVKLLKTLLEGVEMTEKQLGEVFRKFGVEKFDPLNEKFDPNKHAALFQIPDPSKPSGTVAAVVKVGYMLHDRVLRPAEVGVTEGGPTEEEPEDKSGKSLS